MNRRADISEIFVVISWNLGFYFALHSFATLNAKKFYWFLLDFLNQHVICCSPYSSFETGWWSNIKFSYNIILWTIYSFYSWWIIHCLDRESTAAVNRLTHVTDVHFLLPTVCESSPTNTEMQLYLCDEWVESNLPHDLKRIFY